jgi:Na+/melibiose symporter-like transporter
VDWIGGVLITVGILLLLFALTQGNVVGWSTPWIPTLVVVAILIIAAFAFWQRYLQNKGGKKPLMKITIFKNRQYSAGLTMMFLFFAAFNNFLIILTYWYVDWCALA